MEVEIQKREDKINDCWQPKYFLLKVKDSDKTYEFKMTPQIFDRLKAQITHLT